MKTDKEKIEDAFLGHLKLFQSILENMAEGVALTDENGKLILFNPAAERILGMGMMETEPEQFSEHYGLFMTDKVTPYPVDELPLVRAVKGEEVDKCELFVRNRSIPEGIFIRVNARPVKDDEGKLCGGVAVFTDITESRNALESLSESEARFRSMINASFEGIIIYEKNTIIDVNNTARIFFGYTSDEMKGMKIIDLVAEESRSHIIEKLKLVTENPNVELGALEIVSVRKDGSKFSVEVYGKGIQHRGRQVRVIAFRDITDRKQTEKELNYRMEFEDLITSISSNFINLEPDEIEIGIRNALKDIGEFAGVDGSFIALLSEDGKEMKTSYEWCESCVDMQKVRHDNVDKNNFPWFFEILEKREPRYAPDISCLPKDAQTELHTLIDKRAKSVVIVPMVQGRSLKGILGMLTVEKDTILSKDIIVLLKIIGEIFVNAIDRKKTLEDLKNAYEDLELKVEERTRELKEKQVQLINADKMASLGQLVAGVAHEINTPLGALKSNNDVITRSFERVKTVVKDLENDEHQHEYSSLHKLFAGIDKLCQVSKTAVDRITVIVNSLRNFARLDRAEKDTFDIHEGIESTLALVRHEFKNRITIHREFGKIPMISCFPNQINQVFMNILVNAGQAIEGKGDIAISTYAQNRYIVVEFQDSGRGIPEKDIEHIFSPGFTTKGVGVGTGLGLSIVYQIIKDHNGEIDVASKVGEGTLIKISLPINSI